MRRLAAPFLLVCCLLMSFSLALADQPAPVAAPYGAIGVGESAPLDSATVTAGPEGLSMTGEQLSVTDATALEVPSGASVLLSNSVVTSRASHEASPEAGADGTAPVAFSAISLSDGGSAIAFGTTVSSWGSALDLKPGMQPEPGVVAEGAAVFGSDLSSTASDAVAAGPWRPLKVYGSRLVGSGAAIAAAPGADVTVDSIAAGYNDDGIMYLVTGDDRGRWGDGATGSVAEGGTNAIVVAGALAFGPTDAQQATLGAPATAKIAVNKSTLRTDSSRSTGSEADLQKKAYLDHTAGSAVVVRSAGAEIALDGCFVELDAKGTGYLVQTVPAVMQDDLSQQHLPVNVVLRNMSLSGNVAHEDYTRALGVTLFGTRLEGSVVGYDRAHWALAANEEGFSGYCPDDAAVGLMGVSVVLRSGSTWTVTAESHVSNLKISADSSIEGEVYVDGTKVDAGPGMAYSGNIVLRPLAAQADAPSGTPATPSAAPAPADPAPSAPAEHVHQWVRTGGGVADCEHDGAYVYTCFGCGEVYTDPIPAYGHDYVGISFIPATCESEGYETFQCQNCGDTFTMTHAAIGHYWLVDNYVAPTCETNGMHSYVCMNCGQTYSDVVYATGHDWLTAHYEPPTCESDGYETLVCGNCGQTYVQYFPATGHSWILNSHIDATCVTDGEDEYVCWNCGMLWWDPIYAYGHVWSVYPTPGDETMTHTYYCNNCGYSYVEYHTGSDPCWICMYSGPVG